MTFKDWVGQPGGTSGILGIANQFVIPLIFAAATVVFLWGVVNYFFINGTSEDKRSEGKQFMFYGIIGMALMFSVWGILQFFLATLGLGAP